WKEKIEKHPRYRNIVGPEALPEMKIERASRMSADRAERSALLIANRRGDFEVKDSRHRWMSDFLKFSPSNVQTLPLGLELVLKPSELRQLHHWIASHYRVLAALGGSDVHPHVYGEPIRGAVDLSSARDQVEIQLIREYTQVGRGFLVGICRGSQISAVALGYKLIQDLPSSLRETDHHKGSTHEIQILTTRNQILRKAAGQSHVTVNSLHHQSVVFKPGGPLEVAALSREGVVEALEFKNGKGLLLQFHPEITLANPQGESQSFARALSQQIDMRAQVSGARRCQRVYQ
ncbi:MAG: gamma-glutamyl-gamma-aminobutyrate hydrolase family protein, partial [Proteobacteria bacterium]|nr:gamma-glutamyl-gamma-aminobutyrate hydrolase family protein [Pseudomonadota bacterium]